MPRLGTNMSAGVLTGHVFSGVGSLGMSPMAGLGSYELQGMGIWPFDDEEETETDSGDSGSDWWSAATGGGGSSSGSGSGQPYDDATCQSMIGPNYRWNATQGMCVGQAAQPTITCWDRAWGERPPGSTMPFCGTPGSTANVIPPGFPGSDTISTTGTGSSYKPGGAAPIGTGLSTQKPVGGGASSGGGAKAPVTTPIPTTPVQSASMFSNPLVWGGLLLAAGAVAIVAVKAKKKKAAASGMGAAPRK